MKTIRNVIRKAAGCFILVLLILPGSIQAQSTRDLKINEILVLNDSNYVDDYGQHSAWIEIFNSAYNTVDIGGSYLTNDPSNPTKYYIPKGDPITKIAPRNYLVFFADNDPTRGILHLNFTLKESDYFAIYEGNGKELIDAVKFGPQKPDVSYGRLTDGNHEWGFLEKTTPMANNFTGTVESPGEKFVEMDPFGIGMAVIAMSVVFSALILLYVVFKNTKRIYSINLKRLFCRECKKEPVQEVTPNMEISGEVNAAIAMAIHLYVSDLHDHEEAILTIKKVSRTYSPWSSKIYGLRNHPR
jgi:Na+-transporting methylmalonyl-CoA/oxaloacetate decarboxylase gamma subunit